MKILYLCMISIFCPIITTYNVIDDVAFLLPDKQGSFTTASVDRLAGRFSAAVPQEALDALEEEILDYILLPPSALGKFVCLLDIVSSDKALS